jgi:signal transduction histidine kinase/ActR/RegA family two-component response regulator
MGTMLSFRRRLPLRWYLVLLMVGAMLPLVVFTTLVVVRLSGYERAAVERQLTEASGALATELDRSIRGTIATLEAMAQSRELDTGDLESFHAEAQRILPTQPHWRTIILLSPAGQQLVNTLRPVGARLPIANEPHSLRRTVEGGQPVVGNLARGALDGRWAFPVRVPVIRNTQVKYVLTATVTADALAKLIGVTVPQQHEWTRALVDRDGVIGARTRASEAHVGRPGSPEFVRRIRTEEQGLYRDVTVDGADAYVAFARAPLSGWTAAIAVPAPVVHGPPRRQLGAIGGLGAALLAVTGGGAFLLARRVAGRIADAATAAEAIADGERPAVADSGVEEVARLHEALRQSAALLARRQAERDRLDREREELLERAEAASRAKDDFLATLSHELRTPMTAILGWAGMLRSGRLGAAEREQAMDVIQRNARIQRQLIDELLDVSRIVAGKLELDIAPTDVRDIVGAAAETMRPAADAKGVALDCAACDSPVIVDADSARLQQVFVNLLGNAVKFTPSGGRVEVAVEVSGDRATVSVRDTGRGIDPAFLPHIFDRFRQASAAGTTSRGGLGLGLAIAHHLVRLHGGTIRAESAGEGQGARFAVTLPLSLAAARRAAPAADGHAQLLAGTRIVVVDDEPDTLQMLATTLRAHQAVVVPVASVDEALGALASSVVDVLVSDIRMPDKDGYVLIEAVRAREAAGGRRLTAVALTADAGLEDRERARRAGFDVHIAKPVDPGELVTALAALRRRPAVPSP